MCQLRSLDLLPKSMGAPEGLGAGQWHPVLCFRTIGLAEGGEQGLWDGQSGQWRGRDG